MNNVMRLMILTEHGTIHYVYFHQLYILDYLRSIEYESCWQILNPIHWKLPTFVITWFHNILQWTYEKRNSFQSNFCALFRGKIFKLLCSASWTERFVKWHSKSIKILNAAGIAAGESIMKWLCIEKGGEERSQLKGRKNYFINYGEWSSSTRFAFTTSLFAIFHIIIPV